MGELSQAAGEGNVSPETHVAAVRAGLIGRECELVPIGAVAFETTPADRARVHRLWSCVPWRWPARSTLRPRSSFLGIGVQPPMASWGHDGG